MPRPYRCSNQSPPLRSMPDPLAEQGDPTKAIAQNPLPFPPEEKQLAGPLEKVGSR